MAYRLKPRIKMMTVRAGGVTQVVEQLPSKYEAMSSNPSIALPKNGDPISSLWKIIFI
jgi:hypothetical protein